MPQTPESMVAELAAWNQGRGIDLKAWAACTGNFGLAVGYITVFWPSFVEFDGYILREGFSAASLRGFEESCNGDRRAVETVMNHLHLADIQHAGCDDASQDKLLLLGQTLAEIYEAKLSWQFPERPCRVSLYIPQDRSDLLSYEISFWQKSHENASETSVSGK